MRIVKSQMPMPPMPGGAPPMGDPMMGMGAPPGPPPPPPGPPPITKPIENVGELLIDMDAQKLLASYPDADDAKLANIIWEKYGGELDGGYDPQKTGKRTDDQNPDPNVQAKEMDDTDKKRWERLPLGKNISDITQLGELEGLMKSLKFSIVKKLNTPPAPPGGAPPGGMPMASTYREDMLRLASELSSSDPDIAEEIRGLF